MTHKFMVGHVVNFAPGMLRNVAGGPYEICRLMPEGDSDRNNPRYRIKSIEERHERVAAESDLSPFDGPGAVFSSPAQLSERTLRN